MKDELRSFAPGPDPESERRFLDILARTPEESDRISLVERVAAVRSKIDYDKPDPRSLSLEEQAREIGIERGVLVYHAGMLYAGLERPLSVLRTIAQGSVHQGR